MLKGIFPVLPTCFHPDGNLHREEQKKVIHFAISAGAHGLVFPGVASEYDFLTRQERSTLIEILAHEVDGRIPIIVGISAKETAEVIELGKDALRLEIFHFMLMAPAHLGRDLDKHQAFFTEVTEALPQASIILQNAPVPIGAGLESPQLLKIIAENPSINYIKEETLPSGPTISSLLDHDIPHLLGVFGGGGARYIIDEFTRGAVGAVPAVELIDLHVALFNAFANEETTKARSLYRISLPMLTAQKIYRMKLTKYVLQKRGVCDALQLRAPSLELDDHAKADIDAMLEELNRENVLSWTA